MKQERWLPDSTRISASHVILTMLLVLSAEHCGVRLTLPPEGRALASGRGWIVKDHVPLASCEMQRVRKKLQGPRPGRRLSFSLASFFLSSVYRVDPCKQYAMTSRRSAVYGILKL